MPGSSSLRVTVTFPIETAEAVRAAVADGLAPSISAFIRHAVKISLDDVAEWGRMLDEDLEATGGPPTPDEIARADRALGLPPLR